MCIRDRHYSARLHGLSRAASRPAVEQVKERCGLTEVGKRLIGNLSKGCLLYTSRCV